MITAVAVLLLLRTMLLVEATTLLMESLIRAENESRMIIHVRFGTRFGVPGRRLWYKVLFIIYFFTLITTHIDIHTHTFIYDRDMRHPTPCMHPYFPKFCFRGLKIVEHGTEEGIATMVARFLNTIRYYT